MDYVNKFAKRLVELREKKGLSQQQLADKLKITRQSLSLYEKAERTINIELLGKIADVFNVSADYLLGFSDVQSVDANTQAISKSTGLSEKALQNIQIFKEKRLNNIVNKIVESSHFISFIEECRNTYKSQTEYSEKVYEENIVENRDIDISIDTHQYRAEKEIREILQKLQPAYEIARWYETEFETYIFAEKELYGENKEKEKLLEYHYKRIIENLEKERELNADNNQEG